MTHKTEFRYSNWIISYNNLLEASVCTEQTQGQRLTKLVMPMGGWSVGVVLGWEKS